MKTAEAKPASKQATKTAQPFFNKGGGGMFSNEAENGNGSFFSTNRNSIFQHNNKPIQTKLTIGQPNDKYEREADHIADKVVQRLSKSDKSPSTIETGAPLKAVQTKPLAPVASITPLIQTKCSSCEQEEKLQKKEEEHEPDLAHGKLQKKPIFESNAKPPDEDNHVQRKCADCEKEEKLQKKESDTDTGFANSSLQLKPIFESNAAPEERLQRKCASCEQEENLQKQESSGGSQTAAPSVESSLSASKGGGSPLPESTRMQMESSMGADFSGVRVHNNSAAAQLSDNLNAQAFTHGNDIYFNSGKYSPNSNEGKHLLAHELTHTVQQGGGLKRKESVSANIQKATAAPKLTPTSSEVVNISSGQFSPSEKVKAEIEEAGEKGLDVRVVVPKISREGKIKVKGDHKGNYDAVNGQTGYMPINNVLADKIGGLYLVFHLKNNAIAGGIVSTKMKSPNVSDWLNALKVKSELLGAVGLKIGNLPTPVNEFAGDTYKIGVNDLHVEVGGFIDAKVNFVLENATAAKIEASANINVKGIAKGQLILDNTNGPLTGEVSLAIEYKDFSGNATVKLKEDGSIDIHGKAGYNANKLSGEVEFVSTDSETAENFAKDAIKAAGGVEKAKEVTQVPMLPATKEGKKQRALAATGQLQFSITNWFAGTVNVIVDGEGHVTVIGKIAPPAEVELFKQKNYDKEIISLQVEAGYGIPVIGTIGVFAGVILSAVAYIGPAKLYNIEIEGTYSTNPAIQKSIQISASLNISAYAGLRLRAEGGAKLTILSHDLKIGVGVNADVGVKAYTDARPTIGYRDPGVFFISGTAELVAQPMLGLSGDFFIDLKTPWWSPLSDDRWTWPIGSKEWPLSDPIGLSATMKEYVLGSGVAPDIEFKKPEFNPSKFMTSMVDKTLPDKSGAGKDGKGGFTEDPMPPPPVPDKKPKKGEKAEDPKTAKGTTPKGLPAKKAKPDSKAQQEAIEIFKQAAPKLTTIKKPITKGDLKKELDKIEHEVKGIKYIITLSGNQWIITSSAKEVNNPKPVNFAAIVTDEDKKGDDKKDNIEAVTQEINKEGKEKIADGEVTKADADKIIADVKKDHPTVIQSISVIDGGETWDFEYVQRATIKNSQRKRTAPKLPDPPLGHHWVKESDTKTQLQRNPNYDGILLEYDPNAPGDKKKKIPPKFKEAEKSHLSERQQNLPKPLQRRVDISDETKTKILIRSRVITVKGELRWLDGKTQMPIPGDKVTIHPTTGKKIKGNYAFGHNGGDIAWKKYQDDPKNQKKTREEVIKDQNKPEIYWLEEPRANSIAGATANAADK